MADVMSTYGTDVFIGGQPNLPYAHKYYLDQSTPTPNLIGTPQTLAKTEIPEKKGKKSSDKKKRKRKEITQPPGSGFDFNSKVAKLDGKVGEDSTFNMASYQFPHHVDSWVYSTLPSNSASHTNFHSSLSTPFPQHLGKQLAYQGFESQLHRPFSDNLPVFGGVTPNRDLPMERGNFNFQMFPIRQNVYQPELPPVNNFNNVALNHSYFQNQPTHVPGPAPGLPTNSGQSRDNNNVFIFPRSLPSKEVRGENFRDTNRNVTAKGKTFSRKGVIQTQKKKKTKPKTRSNPDYQISKVQPISTKPIIILDTPNICYNHGKRTVFSVKGFFLAYNYFAERGHHVVGFLANYFIDPRKREKYVIKGDINALNYFIEKSILIITPAQDYDDSYMIQYAKNHSGYIVSNDLYKDHVKKYSLSEKDEVTSWMKEHLISFTFIEDEFLPNPDSHFQVAVNNDPVNIKMFKN